MGMLAAQGKVQLMMDADLATDINDFQKVSQQVKTNIGFKSL
jgi:hypothetical protein